MVDRGGSQAGRHAARATGCGLEAAWVWATTPISLWAVPGIALRPQYQRGYDAGMRSRGIDFRLPRYEPPPIDIRSEYQKGYDAGSGRDLLGSAGDGVFTFTGG